MSGNLLINQFVGADTVLFTPEQRDKAGGYMALMESVAAQLRSQGKKPYIIPMGGSTGLGSWGYIEAAAEIAAQLKSMNCNETFDNTSLILLVSSPIQDLVVSCGSVGSLAGLGIGMHLCCPEIKVHGLCACDDAVSFHSR